MFWSITARLSELKALCASTSSKPSTCSLLNSSVIACTAASHPERCRAHNWELPATAWISAPITLRMALPMILRSVSQIPIGRTPGFLESGIKRQAMKGRMMVGSMKLVHSRLVAAARASQSCLEAPWNIVHNLRQQLASNPEGPAAPWQCKAAWRMVSPVSLSKTTG